MGALLLSYCNIQYFAVFWVCDLGKYVKVTHHQSEPRPPCGVSPRRIVTKTAQQNHFWDGVFFQNARCSKKNH